MNSSTISRGEGTGKPHTGQVPPWMILSKLNESGIPLVLTVGELGLDIAGDGTLMSAAGGDAA